MNTDLTLPLILQLAGVLVIIAEIILPSGGILSIIATCLFGYSLYMVFTEVSTSVGMIFIAADVIVIPVLVIIGLKLLAKSPVTLRKELSSQDGVTSQSPDLEEYLGQEGTALTDLRPAGVAMINHERLDVVTRGEYIEKNTTIAVIAATGNQIIVKQKV